MPPDFIEFNFDGSQSAGRSYPGDRPDDCHPGFMLPSRAMHARVGSAPQTGRCLRAPRHPASAPTNSSQHFRRAKRRPAPSGRASRVRCPTRFAPPWRARSLAPVPGCNAKAGRRPRSRRNQSQSQGLRRPQLVALDGDPYARLKRDEFDLQRNPEFTRIDYLHEPRCKSLWLARTDPGWSRVGSVGNRTSGSGATNFMQIAPNSCKRI